MGSVGEGIKISLQPKWHRHKGLETKNEIQVGRRARPKSAPGWEVTLPAAQTVYTIVWLSCILENKLKSTYEIQQINKTLNKIKVAESKKQLKK